MIGRKESGFTLIEVVVIAPIMVVAIAITITFMVNVLLSMGAKNANISLEVNAQSALFSIKDDIMFANYFEGTIQPNETDSYHAGNWNAYTDKALIVSEIAYTANRQDPNRVIVKIKNTPSPCPEATSLNQSATNTLIYFVSGGKLYRRTIIPDQSNNCAVTYRKQSCPAANASASCPADLLLADYVKAFDITYYSNKTGDPDAPVTSTTILQDPTRYIRFTKADIVLTLERTINGEPSTATAKITLKKAE